ncbi:MAG: hypothetical protein V1787_04300 [Candidatus Micrarchaeota archaeon]
MEKKLVFDSSALISLSETCNAGALQYIKRRLGTRFMAPRPVFEESVGTPSKIKKYGFSALRIKRLFDEGVIEVPEAETDSLAVEVMGYGNSLLSSGKRPLKLIHYGEAACLALMIKTGCRHLAVDEKTLRLLAEAPHKMVKLLQPEYSEQLVENQQALEKWREKTKGMKVIRSAEILAVAAEQGFFKPFGKDEGRALHAAVYALRNAGCSLTSRELAAYEQIRI